ncbi:MAG: hypothetical protein ACRD04_07460 [Terriglobales bacterium]
MRPAFVDDAALHHELDMLEPGDVPERIAGDTYDVGVFSDVGRT